MKANERTVAEEIATLRAMNIAELVERFVQVFGHLPHTKQPTWLWRKIAWKIQEQRLGGLSETAKKRLEELVAEIDLPKQTPPTARRDSTLGTSVMRAWKGREICANAVEGGWEHEGRVFRSLSAIAKHVTGSHWSGRRFFNLTKRKVPL